MANYTAVTRTLNYFRVKDEERFKEIVSKMATSLGEDVKCFTETDEEDNTLYGFGTYDSIVGYLDDGGYELEYFAEDVFKDLQQVVADDDMIIIAEVGNEKLRYVLADAICITPDKIFCMNLVDETKKMVTKMCGECPNLKQY